MLLRANIQTYHPIYKYRPCIWEVSIYSLYKKAKQKFPKLQNTCVHGYNPTTKASKMKIKSSYVMFHCLITDSERPITDHLCSQWSPVFWMTIHWSPVSPITNLWSPMLLKTSHWSPLFPMTDHWLPTFLTFNYWSPVFLKTNHWSSLYLITNHWSPVLPTSEH